MTPHPPRGIGVGLSPGERLLIVLGRAIARPRTAMDVSCRPLTGCHPEPGFRGEGPPYFVLSRRVAAPRFLRAMKRVLRPENRTQDDSLVSWWPGLEMVVISRKAVFPRSVAPTCRNSRAQNETLRLWHRRASIGSAGSAVQLPRQFSTWQQLSSIFTDVLMPEGKAAGEAQRGFRRRDGGRPHSPRSTRTSSRGRSWMR